MKLLNAWRYLWSLWVRKTPKPDPFINWLRFANPGMLNEGNIYCIEFVAENLPSENPIVEIGRFCGLSTNTINYELVFKNPNYLFRKIG